MAHPNEEFVREGYAAFARGDLDMLQNSFFASDVRWHYPGRSEFGGDLTDVGELMAWLGRSFEVSGGTVRVELHDVIGNDEHVVALTTLRAEREGRALADNAVQVFHVHDGKVTEVWTHPADLYAVDAFWS